jgi:hypothetical protein
MCKIAGYIILLSFSAGVILLAICIFISTLKHETKSTIKDIAAAIAFAAVMFALFSIM